LHVHDVVVGQCDTASVHVMDPYRRVDTVDISDGPY